MEILGLESHFQMGILLLLTMGMSLALKEAKTPDAWSRLGPRIMKSAVILNCVYFNIIIC